MRHWFGRPRRGHCLMFVLYLYLTGRIVRIKRTKGHFIGVSRWGTAVHLKCLSEDDRHRRCPPWYTGRPHAFR